MLISSVIPTQLTVNDADYYDYGPHGTTIRVDFNGAYQADDDHDIFIREAYIKFGLSLDCSRERMNDFHKFLTSGKKIAILIGEPDAPVPQSDEGSRS